MDHTIKDLLEERMAKLEAEHALEETREQRDRQRAAFRAKLLPGTDMFAWVAPNDAPPSDQLLAEHCAQLRTLVRYAMQHVFEDEFGSQANMRAADAVTRMIRTNVVLAKALDAKSAKTVHGGKRKREPQD